MRAHGKKYNTAAKNRDEASVYQPKQALEIVKKSAFAKFDETVEVAVRLGVDPRHADQMVRGTVVLPAGTGKSVRVLVIAVGDKAREAEAAGADFVGAEHIAKIKEGWLDFDVMIATPDQMGQVGQLGRVLGPRGLMPNPKAGTVTSVARFAKRKPARSSSVSTRAATCTRRSARRRSRSKRSKRTTRRSWIRSSARSRVRQRASMYAMWRCPAPWAPAFASIPPSTGNER